MPIQLLPASAAAFAPRSTVNVVLNSKVEPWLTQTLKRVNRVKRPLNSVQQHSRCLTETLSGPNAMWSLCSIMVPKAPDSELRKDSNPLVEALFNYQLIHIEAYVVHVDMVSQHEVAFKLTPETIEALIEYHKDIYSVDVSASTWEWAEKEQQLKKLQDKFVQAVQPVTCSALVRTTSRGRGEDVKSAIMGLFLPLLPPPPRIVDVVRPAPLLPSSPGSANWWAPTQHIPVSHAAPMDSWRVVPSTPSPTIGTCGETQPSFWSTMGTMGFEAIQLPSPTPSFSQPYNCTSPYTSSSYYSPPPASAPIPALPLPSVLAQQCGSSAVHGGFGGFGWDTGFAPQYAAFV
ncbi:hypothetical protein SNOG_11801 [Parastagonospora nodorum SN15]|uniref:Uncharacterized protein n=1 Tax=Phaeosphaeria nodorum (strain SN15 / ATCC MYA-4574 / FGSC 10173) TaxID=321614 RepID=Q0U8W3_PHANO|nr:hypothetical protein SNOG_11801 [Parastagonospora nodorum SN15]EAT80845.2 hypothetical protein SNOG_11801 [Parastagonospora nodorum SN15]